MKKIALLFNRVILMLGVIVALTPCGICNSAAMNQTSVCPMTHMGNMKCCQAHKSHSPVCKVMDQSSLPVSGVHLNVADIPVISFTAVLPSPSGMVSVSPQLLFDTSPPKPLVLRI